MKLKDGTPWEVAAARALLSASLVGGLGFLATWSSTDDVKTLVTAGLTPALTSFALRLGVEGYVDSRKK